MTLTHHRRNILIAALAGVAVAALVTVFFLYGQKPAAPPAQASAEADPNALNIPTIDEMCAALGQGAAEVLKACQEEQSAAGEYVIAWMGLNGFLAGGSIDFAAIQFGAELGSSDPLVVGTDASIGDIDPATGEPLVVPTAASIALMCLGQSPDWVTMQACIGQNDPSAGFESAIGAEPAESPAGAQ